MNGKTWKKLLTSTKDKAKGPDWLQPALSKAEAMSPKALHQQGLDTLSELPVLWLIWRLLTTWHNHPLWLCSEIHVLLLDQEGLQRLSVVSTLPGTANDEGVSSHYELKIHFIQHPTALCAGLSTGYLWVISTSCSMFAGSPYRSPGRHAQRWMEIPWTHSQWV